MGMRPRAGRARKPATFRLPARSWKRARREGASPAGWRTSAHSRGKPWRSTSFRGLPRRWPRRSRKTSRELKVSRENYFYSLLDAAYRQSSRETRFTKRTQERGNEEIAASDGLPENAG